MIFLLRHPSTLWQSAALSEDAAEPIPLCTGMSKHFVNCDRSSFIARLKTSKLLLLLFTGHETETQRDERTCLQSIRGNTEEESRKPCGSSSALCTISFSFPKRQCSVTGTLHLMNTFQVIAHSNLTTVFGLIFFNDQHCLFHFIHYSFPILGSVFFQVQYLKRY